MSVASAPRRTPCARSFRVYGFDFHLSTNLPEAERLFARLYRDFMAPSPAKSAQALIEADARAGFRWRLDEKTGTSASLHAALWNLEAALCENIIRSQRRTIALHAATILVGNSSALLAGCSRAGKTTLSLALAGRRFGVPSDDVALIEPETLGILPIPRCFHLDNCGAALLEAQGIRLPDAWQQFRFIVPNDFDAPATTGLHAGTLIFIRGPRAGRPHLTPVSQAEMTARLLSETGQGPLADRETIDVICRLSAGAACFVLTPGPLGETADAVAELLAENNGVAA